MVEYADFISTAQELITEFGRSITLVQFDGIPATPAQPWKGATDPRAAPTASLILDAVFVEPASAVKLGLAAESSDLIKRSEQILMVSPGADADVQIYHEVIDNHENWKIQGVTILRPGAEVVLAFIGVKQ